MLKTWAAGQTLLRADHYFWILGPPKQKSIEGLLRSLLYTALRTFSLTEYPDKIDAIRKICGTRWESADKQGTWTCKELKEMMSRLASVQGVKIFFFVDALDECEPQDRLGDLADVVLWLSQLRNVKLCVSCRAWDVFNQKFDKAPILHLDLLTYGDMATYIEARLTSTESEVGLESDFQRKTEPALTLVHDTAHAAEGVFLWVELVTKAICSEMRKGENMEQLTQIISQFPADLDDYFNRLIFDRIGKSRQNTADTAFALILAMQIAIFNKRVGESLPHATSYCNFWLLSKGLLNSGFSWTDYIDPSQLERERMMKQTAAFLEETCKDLLVLREQRVDGDAEVDFLHRTVFDYLSENMIRLSLEQQAPSHLSENDFMLNLARLRCICLLKGAHTSCSLALNLLDKVLLYSQHDKVLDVSTSWFSSCEALAITKFKTHCTCFGLAHKGLCISDGYRSAGRSNFLIQSTRIMPFQMMITTTNAANQHDLSFLGRILQVAASGAVEASCVALLRHVLEHGSHADFLVQCWPDVQKRGLDAQDGDVAMPGRSFSWCDRTYWEAWLSETFIDIMKAGQKTRMAEQEDVGGRTPDRRYHVSMVAELLLYHGADPCCTPCIADHSLEELCRYMPLHELLGHIVPLKYLARLRRIQATCAHKTNRHHLRRNQHRRAMRSYAMSEQNFKTKLADAALSKEEHRRRLNMWRVEQTSFLQSLLWPLHQSWDNNRCSLCPNRLGGCDCGLVSWCVDCWDVSSKCLGCCLLFPFEAPALESSCGSLFDNCTPSTRAHFCVTVARGRSKDQHPPESEWWSNCRARYSAPKALSMLQKWYFRNPLESNETPEDAIRGQTSLSPRIMERATENKSAKRKR
jgi:hypothetical protein